MLLRVYTASWPRATGTTGRPGKKGGEEELGRRWVWVEEEEEEAPLPHPGLTERGGFSRSFTPWLPPAASASSDSASASASRAALKALGEGGRH